MAAAGSCPGRVRKRVAHVGPLQRRESMGARSTGVSRVPCASGSSLMAGDRQPAGVGRSTRMEPQSSSHRPPGIKGLDWQQQPRTCDASGSDGWQAGARARRAHERHKCAQRVGAARGCHVRAALEGVRARVFWWSWWKRLALVDVRWTSRTGALRGSSGGYCVGRLAAGDSRFFVCWWWVRRLWGLANQQQQLQSPAYSVRQHHARRAVSCADPC